MRFSSTALIISAAALASAAPAADYSTPAVPPTYAPKSLDCGAPGGVWLRMNDRDDLQALSRYTLIQSTPKDQPSLYMGHGLGNIDEGQTSTLFGRTGVLTHRLKVDMIWYVKAYMEGEYTLKVNRKDDKLFIGAGGDCADGTAPKIEAVAGQSYTITVKRVGAFVRFKTQLLNSGGGPFGQSFELKGPDGKVLLNDNSATDDIYTTPCGGSKYSPVWTESGLVKK